MVEFGNGGADGGAGARNILALVANYVGGVEDQQEHRNEDEAPVVPEVQAMQPHESGAKPEHVGDEERRPSGTPFRSCRCTK